MALTHDSWTSLAQESYETVTCLYLTLAWELRGKVLVTKKVEQKTENIGRFLLGVKEKWTLPDDITMTTDNAAVEVKSCRDINWPRIGCAGHTINLIVRDVLKDKTLSRLIAKGRNIASHFHVSLCNQRPCWEAISITAPVSQPPCPGCCYKVEQHPGYAKTFTGA